MKDIIIIGAGVVGCAIARELSKYKLDVIVLEEKNDVAMGATKANSAIVHGGYAESHNKIKGRLCHKGRLEYDRLNKELNFGFSKIGSMVLAFNNEDLYKLQDLMDNGIKNGLKDLEIIYHEQILNMEPNISEDVKYALYCKGAGVTSPYEMATALMENAIHNGVVLKLNTKVTGIEKVNETFKVKCNNGLYEGKVVINCAGVKSDYISSLVGINYFKIMPRSGEYILFERGSGSLVNHVLFQMPTKMGKGILVTPTYHGNLLLGPDAYNDSDVELGTHCERLIKIYEAANKTTDKINPKKFLRSFTGVRPVSSTDDFIIENSKVNGFIQCAGIQSPGLTSSPAIALMVRDIIDNKLIRLNKKENFDPYRKPIIIKKDLLPMKDIVKYVNMESGDERIICRCEQVSEKTIKDALSREIPVTSIDGVKRRTRAGMGWCQGTFCRPRVKKLMEDYLNIKVDDTTDIEQSGINRVNKNDFLEYLNNENKEG